MPKSTICRSAPPGTVAPSKSVIDIAAGHPGVVSFLLAPAITPDPAATPDSNTAAAVLGVFGVDPETTTRSAQP